MSCDALGSRCRVIFMSGYGHESLDVRDAVLLHKPFGRAKLAGAIAAAFGRDELAAAAPRS